MVKCLIRIKTKVNVHLRMINHCYRDVKVRVLSLGPRLLGKALGVLPLFPALPGGSSTSSSGPVSGHNSKTCSRLTVPPQLHGCIPPANCAGKNQGWIYVTGAQRADCDWNLNIMLPGHIFTSVQTRLELSMFLSCLNIVTVKLCNKAWAKFTVHSVIILVVSNKDEVRPE